MSCIATANISPHLVPLKGRHNSCEEQAELDVLSFGWIADTDRAWDAVLRMDEELN